MSEFTRDPFKDLQKISGEKIARIVLDEQIKIAQEKGGTISGVLVAFRVEEEDKTYFRTYSTLCDSGTIYAAKCFEEHVFNNHTEEDEHA